MEFDEHAAAAKLEDIRLAAAVARRTLPGLSEETIERAVGAFASVTPPEQPSLTIGLVTVSSLYSSPKAQSRKLGNVLLNWRKLVDIVPDVSLAGLGAATLPVSPAWSAALAGLYVWNKLWRGTLEEFTDLEATVILALWKSRNRENKVAESDGFDKTNALRATYSLPPLTRGQFKAVIDRLTRIQCVELEDGILWLREWVRVKYS